MAEKILVIEDESNIADFLRRGLVTSGSKSQPLAMGRADLRDSERVRRI